MLVLYGPPGCGKSTCVRALAKQLGIHLRQWIDHGNRGTSHSSLKVQSSNAVQPWFADDVDVSTRSGGGGCVVCLILCCDVSHAVILNRSAYEVPFTSVLQDFVDFLHQTNVFAPLVLQTNGSSTPKQHRSIVLLEDVPRPRDASGLAKLRHALLQCIRRSGSVVHRCPIVMICSDAGGDQDGTASLSSLERWLSPEVVHHPAVTCLQ
jgi:DNA polymerase III delta prime subunit